jgi:hypothetical protein
MTLKQNEEEEETMELVEVPDFLESSQGQPERSIGSFRTR